MNAPTLDLRSTRTRVPRADAFATCVRLRGRHGDDDIYLLESLAGDATDRRTATVGVGPVLGLAVRGRRVEFTGVGGAVAALRSALADLLAPSDDGGLRVADGATAWELLRRWCAVVGGERVGSGPSFVLILGYDAARHVERLPWLIPDRHPCADVSVRLYQAVLHVDLVDNTGTLVLHHSPHWPTLPDDEDLWHACDPGPDLLPDVPAPLDVRDEFTRERFCAAVGRALEHVGCGDVYQVQIGHEVRVRSRVDPWAVYLRLRRRNPSPYMFYVPTGDGGLLIGASPELFVRVEDEQITMRPIAGTLPYGVSDGPDMGPVATSLRTDPKETAEHLMLVDLCRNDIGRVCTSGTLAVQVDRLVARYSHVLHLVSSVAGGLCPGGDALDVITATFPAGTMTGAPKIRAMEIIENLEASRRGLYAGAVGLLGRDGQLNTALCIRSVVVRGREFSIRASAGVVADSVPGGWRPGDQILVELPNGSTVRCRIVNVLDDGTVEVVPEHPVDVY